MPRTQSNSTIKTIWENNSDTPITSTNLSKALDLIASYKNFNVGGMHGEYSLLAINPNDSSQLLFKRGSILQVINEATDDAGTPIIPKNEQYKIFDVGLDDIILTTNDTDASLSEDQSQWGNGGEIKKWFVYLCDKDDSTIYSKDTPSEYGGGAQVLISNYNNGPYRASPPGRPTDEYTEKDTRIIGGFKTNGNTITEIWDIAGKYKEVKAKGYSILDEHSGENDYLYRQIDVRDLNTARNSVFNGSLTVNQSTNLQSNLTVSGNTTFNTSNLLIDSTNGEISFVDDGTPNLNIHANTFIFDTTTLNNSVTINAPLTINGDSTQEGNSTINGNVTVNLGSSERFKIAGRLTQTGPVKLGNIESTSITSVGYWEHTGTFDHSGTYKITGTVEVDGQYSLASDSLTIRTLTPVATNGSGDPVYHSFKFVVPDVPTLSNPIYTYHKGNMEVEGFTYSHSGSASFAINKQGNSEMIAFGNSFTYEDSGTNPLGYNIKSNLHVKKYSDEVVFEVNKDDKITNGVGSFNFTLEDDDVFSVKGDNSILSVEKDPAAKVVISGNLEVNGGNITANLIGDVTGNLFGNASTATQFESPLTINFADTNSDLSSGSVTFSGNESTIITDLLIDRNKWYNIDDLDPSPGSDSGTGVLDSRYYTQTQVANMLTSGGNVEWTGISNRPQITLTGGLDGVIDLADGTNEFSINVVPENHTHEDIYYADQSDFRYYTKDDLRDYTTVNTAFLPEINWQTLIEIPYEINGAKDTVSAGDHTHTFNVDVMNNPFTFDDVTAINLQNAYVTIAESELETKLLVEDFTALSITNDFFILPSDSGNIEFCFTDGVSTTPDAPASYSTVRKVEIDITTVESIEDIVTAISTSIATQPEFETTHNSRAVTITHVDGVMPNTDVVPYSENQNLIVFKTVFGNYDFYSRIDAELTPLALGNNVVQADENYLLSSDVHLDVGHKVLGIEREHLLLSSQTDFSTFSYPTTPHIIPEYYDAAKEFAYPSSHNDNSLKEENKVAIHIDNIYIPSGYSPEGTMTPYIDVSADYDETTNTLNSYTINDVPFISYLEQYYPTRSEIGISSGSLEDSYYLKSVINPSSSTLGTEAASETDVDWTETNLDWRYYTEFEINPGNNGYTAASSTNAPNFSVTSPLDYRYYTQQYIDSNFDNYQGFNIQVNSNPAALVSSGNTFRIGDSGGTSITQSGLDVTISSIYANSFSLQGGELNVGYSDGSGGGTGLNFDDRYYTESEVDNNFYSKTEITAGYNITLDTTSGLQINAQSFVISDVTFNNSTFDLTISQSGNTDKIVNLSHNHDGSYYTQSQLNTGTLDPLYYPRWDLNPSITGGYTPADVNDDPDFSTPAPLDERYYTEEEVNTKMDTLCQSIATATGNSITNPFTGTTFNP